MRNASGFALKGTLYSLIICCLVSTAIAQSDTGVLFGVITDPAARTVVGARATLRNNATGSSREYVTDERGVYFFTFLAPGNYTLTLQSTGFKQYQDTDVRIQVAQVTRIDISMEIGSTKEVLDISGLSNGIKHGERFARNGGGSGKDRRPSAERPPVHSTVTACTRSESWRTHGAAEWYSTGPDRRYQRRRRTYEQHHVPA